MKQRWLKEIVLGVVLVTTGDARAEAGWLILSWMGPSSRAELQGRD
jgi:hypothetical protein